LQPTRSYKGKISEKDTKWEKHSIITSKTYTNTDHNLQHRVPRPQDTTYFATLKKQNKQTETVTMVQTAYIQSQHGRQERPRPRQTQKTRHKTKRNTTKTKTPSTNNKLLKNNTDTKTKPKMKTTRNTTKPKTTSTNNLSSRQTPIPISNTR
jgi:hypothetical protein